MRTILPVLLLYFFTVPEPDRLAAQTTPAYTATVLPVSEATDLTNTTPPIVTGQQSGRACLYVGEELFDLGGPFGVTHAAAINDRGLVVGDVQDNLFWGPAAWSLASGFRPLFGLVSGANQAYATGVNNLGIAVGVAPLVGPRATLWVPEPSPDAVDLNQYFSIPGRTLTHATGINSFLEVVGNSAPISGPGAADRGFLISSFGILLLALPPGHWYSSVKRITERGIAVGDAWGGTVPTWHVGVRWDSPGQATVLTVPPRAVEVHAEAINEAGFVVGWATGSFGPERVRKAFLWDESNQVRDLNELAALPAGVHLEHAWAINNAGHILARSSSEVYLLSPR
jgi:probable HAF family extracellular repeat protein